VIVKLPLDSPHWAELDACYSRERAMTLLREIVASRQLGQAWERLREELQHQGSVYGMTSAALPYLVELAEELPADEASELLIDVAFYVAAGAASDLPPVPGMQESVAESLRVAERLALEFFLAGASSPSAADMLAQSCVVLSGHPGGAMLWEYVSPTVGYVTVVCPGCDTDDEVSGFADPHQPPCVAPRVPEVVVPHEQESPWASIATAIDAAIADEILGPGWDDFLRVGRSVAAAGVPAATPMPAIWCLIAAMTAARGPAGTARSLARLAGHYRCAECDEVWWIAEMIGDGNGEEATPVDASVLDPATIADATGFKPAPTRHRPLSRRDLRPRWHAAADPATTLTVFAVPGQRLAIAAGAATGMVRLFDLDTGEPTGRPFRASHGPVQAMCAIPSGDSAVLVVADESGNLCWWNPISGLPLGETISGPGTPILSIAAIPMPQEPRSGVTDWLAPLWDGRVVLVTGGADGAVKLWDATTRGLVGEVFRRPGQPVISMAGFDLSEQPPWAGGEIVTIYGDMTVDTWSTQAVHGQRSTMGPTPEGLAALGHDRLIGVAVVPGSIMTVALADRDGTLSVWETNGVRRGDPLPPDPGHGAVVAVALLSPPAGPVVATASAAGRSVRLWEPAEDATRLVPLAHEPACLLALDDMLFVGHDQGVSAFVVSEASDCLAVSLGEP
jgi:hypothetical protein